jgi:hypothetical protein
MPKTRQPKFRDLLECLCRHRVEYIVVGGVAAVLQGAPIATFDVDIVHSRAPENLDRLMVALADLDARYRDQTGRDLPPQRSLLAGDGHNLLMTRVGPLDALGSIGAGLSYEALLPETVAMQLDAFVVRLLSLEALIRVKEELARDKDRAMIAILRRTLDEQRRR